MQNIAELDQQRIEAIEDWVRISTVKSVVPGLSMPRSPALQEVDRAVADLAEVYRGDERQAFAAAQAVAQRLRDWRATKAPGHVSIREGAVARLQEALRSIIDRFYDRQAEEMRQVPPIPGGSLQRVWLHGTDAIAEILASGQVWGGTAALKNIGSDEAERAAVAEQRQGQHFFMALTQGKGTTPSPGNAFVKGRQAADAKIRQGNHLPSWMRGGRPLMGVIEFPVDPQQDLVEGAIRSMSTVAHEDANRSILPLAELRPGGIRMINEGDVVRMLDYVAATDRAQLQSLPPVIRVLTAPHWNGGDTDAWLELLRDTGDYKRLMTEAEPQAWTMYETAAVLHALAYT